MITTQFLISALKSRYCIDSFYGVAKALEVTKAAAYDWKHGRTTIGEPVARRVADLLGVDVSVIYAAMQAEKATDPHSKAIWIGIYAKIGGQDAYDFIKKTCFDQKKNAA